MEDVRACLQFCDYILFCDSVLQVPSSICLSVFSVRPSVRPFLCSSVCAKDHGEIGGQVSWEKTRGENPCGRQGGGGRGLLRLFLLLMVVGIRFTLNALEK